MIAVKTNLKAEMAALDRDFQKFGVCVGEYVGGQLIRLDPSFLCYSFSQRQWIYQSSHGAVVIESGDSRFHLRSQPVFQPVGKGGHPR